MAPVVGALFTGKVALVEGACTFDEELEDEADEDDELEEDEDDELEGEAPGLTSGGEPLEGPTSMAAAAAAAAEEELVGHCSWLLAEILRRKSYGL